MSYRHLSDRRRIELVLPIHALRDIVIHGANDDPETQKCLDHLNAALEAVLQDKPAVIGRSVRIYQKALGHRYVEGAQVDEIGLAVYFWLKALTESDYLQIGEDDLGQALAILLPALEHAVERDGAMLQARTIGADILTTMQGQGLYPGINFSDWVEAA